MRVYHKPAHNLKWTERLFCTVTEELRTIIDPYCRMEKDIAFQNIPIILSLVNELQVYGNRMEAALEDQSAYKEIKEEYKKLKEEVKVLEEKKKALEGDANEPT